MDLECVQRTLLNVGKRICAQESCSQIMSTNQIKCWTNNCNKKTLEITVPMAISSSLKKIPLDDLRKTLLPEKLYNLKFSSILKKEELTVGLPFHIPPTSTANFPPILGMYIKFFFF